jgi:hypothetical protein
MKIVPAYTIPQTGPCNGATPRSRTQFARLWQQLHHFRHRIAKDDPRRPTSAGLTTDEVARSVASRGRRPPVRADRALPDFKWRE